MGLMQMTVRGLFNFLRNVFILDTGLTISATVMNKELVTNIKKAKIPTIMTTNAGTKILDTEASIPNFGRAMLDASQSANVLGFLDLIENFRATYNSNEEDAFVVHTNWGPIKFVNQERLYVYEPSENTLNSFKT